MIRIWQENAYLSQNLNDVSNLELQLVFILWDVAKGCLAAPLPDGLTYNPTPTNINE